jgi:hypothetical protein
MFVCHVRCRRGDEEGWGGGGGGGGGGAADARGACGVVYMMIKRAE